MHMVCLRLYNLDFAAAHGFELVLVIVLPDGLLPNIFDAGWLLKVKSFRHDDLMARPSN